MLPEPIDAFSASLRQPERGSFEAKCKNKQGSIQDLRSPLVWHIGNCAMDEYGHILREDDGSSIYLHLQHATLGEEKERDTLVSQCSVS